MRWQLMDSTKWKAISVMKRWPFFDMIVKVIKLHFHRGPAQLYVRKAVGALLNTPMMKQSTVALPRTHNRSRRLTLPAVGVLSTVSAISSFT